MISQQLMLWPSATSHLAEMTLMMFYSRSLMLTNIRRRLRPLCSRQVYYIYVIQCSLLRTYMIVETTQCVASLGRVPGYVLPLIRKSIRTHADHSFGLLLKGFEIPLLPFRQYTWQVRRNRKCGRKWLQTLTHKNMYILNAWIHILSSVYGL